MLNNFTINVESITYGLSTETNTFLGVKDGSLITIATLALFFFFFSSHVRSTRLHNGVVTYLPHKGLDATGTTVGLVESNLANDLVTVVPNLELAMRS